MTDLEITKACAEAMGFKLRRGPPDFEYIEIEPNGEYYNPLHDDAQAMALVKKFRLHIDSNISKTAWSVFWMSWGGDETVVNANLNRAICECVAKLITNGAMNES